LPQLQSGPAVIRELRHQDAVDLFQAMTRADVTRFISPPPATIHGFEQFIAWAERERTAGTHVCLAILAPGTDTTVGLIQIRALEGGFRVAEWGFALAPEFWGTGLFLQCASLALQFAFAELGVHRLEARAVVRNGRGNAALRKLGAVQEGVLRQAFYRNGEYMDQVLWSILADDWWQARPGSAATAFH
jgi:ribosomal-protein-alanine N-acetyltransferase